MQLHHVSALFVHHSRRVRLLTASVHALLLQIPIVRERIVFFLRETASSSQLEAILGTWCIAAHDIDRSIASMTMSSWSSTISCNPDSNDLMLDEYLLSPLAMFVQRAILDPSVVYMHLNLAQIPVASIKKPLGGMRREKERESERGDFEVGTRAKAEDMEENEQDRKARLRVGALGALRWMLGILIIINVICLGGCLTPFIRDVHSY